jgi:hypothetical protein
MPQEKYRDGTNGHKENAFYCRKPKCSTTVQQLGSQTPKRRVPFMIEAPYLPIDNKSRGKAFQLRSACELPFKETGESASHILGRMKMQGHFT